MFTWHPSIKLISHKKIYENAIAQDIAGQVELAGDEFHMQASKLSGGMKRRLAIGIAIVGDPNILFFDEAYLCVVTFFHFFKLVKYDFSI